MKRVAFLSLVAALGATGAVAEGLGPPRQPDAAETVALRAQVAELQQRLEARVEKINRPRPHRAATGDEAPMQWDRLDPAAIDKAAKSRGAPPPAFPAERR